MTPQTKIEPTPPQQGHPNGALIVKTVAAVMNIVWPLCVGGQMLVERAFGPSGLSFFNFVRSYHSNAASIGVATFVNIVTLCYGFWLYSKGNEKMGTFLVAVGAIPMAIITILLLVF